MAVNVNPARTAGIFLPPLAIHDEPSSPIIGPSTSSELPSTPGIALSPPQGGLIPLTGPHRRIAGHPHRFSDAKSSASSPTEKSSPATPLLEQGLRVRSTGKPVRFQDYHPPVNLNPLTGLAHPGQVVHSSSTLPVNDPAGLSNTSRLSPSIHGRPLSRSVTVAGPSTSRSTSNAHVRVPSPSPTLSSSTSPVNSIPTEENRIGPDWEKRYHDLHRRYIAIKKRGVDDRVALASLTVRSEEVERQYQQSLTVLDAQKELIEKYQLNIKQLSNEINDLKRMIDKLKGVHIVKNQTRPA